MAEKGAIFATGAAGYIGSHVLDHLLKAGHRVLVLDNLSSGHRWAVPEKATFVEGDTGDLPLVEALLREHRVRSLMHFAAHIEVEESVRRPEKYYQNNTAKAVELFAACVRAGVQEVVFSSTAAVYAETGQAFTEESPTQPANPYGRSKLFAEWGLRDVCRAHPQMKSVILRYFNVAGASQDGHIGQATPNATHLIKVACQAALGLRPFLKVYGTDYPTRDGTCVRDYIHVDDLAQAHLLALDHLRAGGQSDIFNCGYGQGFTVHEVIRAVKKVSGVDFPVEPVDRRPGDAIEVVANSHKIQEVMGWRPRLNDLEEICRSALEWEKKYQAMSQDQQS